VGLGYAVEARDEIDLRMEQQRSDKREKSITGLTQLLAGVDELEVVTLDPRSEMAEEQRDKVDPASRLDRWMIRLKIRVTDQGEIAQLRTGLLRSIETSAGAVAPCFQPRHGIKFHKDGAEVTMAVCFECGAIEFRGATTLESASITPAAAQDFYFVFRAHGLTQSTRLGSTTDANIAARLVGTWSRHSRGKASEKIESVAESTETFDVNGIYHSETKISLASANSPPSEWQTAVERGIWRVEQGMLVIAGTEPDGLVTRISYESRTPLLEISETRVSYGSLEPGSGEEIVWERK
jgi:hypothetical protein